MPTLSFAQATGSLIELRRRKQRQARQKESGQGREPRAEHGGGGSLTPKRPTKAITAPWAPNRSRGTIVILRAALLRHFDARGAERPGPQQRAKQHYEDAFNILRWNVGVNFLYECIKIKLTFQVVTNTVFFVLRSQEWKYIVNSFVLSSRGNERWEFSQFRRNMSLPQFPKKNVWQDNFVAYVKGSSITNVERYSEFPEARRLRSWRFCPIV